MSALADCRDAADAGTCCAIVELRQYTLHPGRRDDLIALFEREFVESQEACGMRLLGQFRDLDDPDRFVWLRGFADMPRRAEALAAFYNGPVWRAHREAANATMVDSDDVLLLRPARSGSGFALGDTRRAAFGAVAPPCGMVVAMIWQLPLRVGADFVELFERRVAPRLLDAGATPLASFVSEHAANTFPALPVREGENVLVCFAGFDDEAHWRSRFGDLPRGSNARRGAAGDPHILRLAPTARSLLRG
ncbi:NIPSNAP family protein [Dokdonella sp.]|uniref:NIPSNAP family protein n=1 Tax=Dokdonella sp. TaxID=2291710 RepID=UPI001B0607CA|nr:NIPSNAP family protein [Dokdonella sp.]MBO9661578.1 NIPSNAP family protein [Dokdonella sp.]